MMKRMKKSPSQSHMTPIPDVDQDGLNERLLDWEKSFGSETEVFPATNLERPRHRGSSGLICTSTVSISSPLDSRGKPSACSRNDFSEP